VQVKGIKKVLSALRKVVPSRHYNLLLTYLRLTVRDGELRLFGTDEVADVELSIPVEAEREADFLVPGEVLFELPVGAGEEPVTLEVGEGHLYWKVENFKAEVRVAPVENYPEPLFPADGQEVSVPREALARAVARVRHAVARESYRDAFRGILMEFSGAGLRLVATDGYRLALYDFPQGAPFQEKVVVPAEGITKALQVLEATEAEEIAIRLASGVVGLNASGQALSARVGLRLLGKTFPEYGGVIPKDFVAQVLVETSVLREAVRRLDVLADGDNRRLDFALGEGSLRITVKATQAEAEEEVPAQVEGSALLPDFSLNARYLIEALPEDDGETLIRLSGKTTPLLVSPAGREDYQAVLVPLRT
jgi:DNA polymerase-3 subunit beta